MQNIEISDEAKVIGIMVGGFAVGCAICYGAYKWIAVMAGKTIAAELLKAGAVIAL